MALDSACADQFIVKAPDVDSRSIKLVRHLENAYSKVGKVAELCGHETPRAYRKILPAHPFITNESITSNARNPDTSILDRIQVSVVWAISLAPIQLQLLKQWLYQSDL